MLRQVPFIRILIPFILGIICATEFTGRISASFLFVALILLSLCFTILLQFASKWRARLLLGTVVSLLFVFIGFLFTTKLLRGTSLPSGSSEVVVVKLEEPIEDRGTSFRALARVSAIKADTLWEPHSEQVMLYFSKKDTLIYKQEYGNVLVLNTSFNPPAEPLNPYQFNHKKYLERKQIFQTAFVESGKWMCIHKHPSKAKQKAFQLRESLLGVYEKAGIEGQNLAVLSAISMGYKSLLDEETRSVFSASGAMHVLAVSGLHVGIIFASLSFFLYFLSTFKKGRLIRGFLLVAFLWFYAFFTGLSPSVVRASFMFSLVVMGSSFNRTTNVYNTLCASAFVALVFNPLLIYDIGFQLSYCAVLSIVCFQPYIYKLLFVKNRLLDKIWALIAVSLAAQIGTFPLTLFHFAQFPNYFLFTNLYAIPLAFLILYGAIGLLLLSSIPLLSQAWAWALDLILSALNFLTRFTEALPYSTSQAVSIKPFQFFMIALCIVFFVVLLKTKNFKYLLVSLLSGILFFGFDTVEKFQKRNTNELIVFANRSESLIGHLNGDSFLLLTSDSSSINPIQKSGYALQGYANHHRVSPSQIIAKSMLVRQEEVYSHGELQVRNDEMGCWVGFKDKLLFIPSSGELLASTLDKKLAVDYLIINSHSPPIGRILDVIAPNLIVVDQTIPSWQWRRVASEAIRKRIDVYNVSEKGALIL